MTNLKRRGMFCAVMLVSVLFTAQLSYSQGRGNGRGNGRGAANAGAYYPGNSGGHQNRGQGNGNRRVNSDSDTTDQAPVLSPGNVITGPGQSQNRGTGQKKTAGNNQPANNGGLWTGFPNQNGPTKVHQNGNGNGVRDRGHGLGNGHGQGKGQGWWRRDLKGQNSQVRSGKTKTNNVPVINNGPVINNRTINTRGSVTKTTRNKPGPIGKNPNGRVISDQTTRKTKPTKNKRPGR